MATSYRRKRTQTSLAGYGCSIQLDGWHYMPVRPQLTYLFNTIDSLRERHNVQHLQCNYTPERYSSALASFNVVAKAAKSGQKYYVPIILFYDEVCTVSSIGPFSPDQKLSVISWAFPTSKPIENQEVFLLAIGPSTALGKGIEKTNALNRVISHLYMELKLPIELESGGLKAEILAFVCDTLAAAELGGFLKNWASGRKICRSCLTDRNTLDVIGEARNSTNYNAAVKAINSSKTETKRIEKRREYGQTGATSFISNSFENFPQNLTFDIMHDIHEGVMKKMLSHLIGTIVQNYGLSLNILNKAINCFKFTRLEKSIGRPRNPFQYDDKQVKIRATAGQTRVLGSRLPLILHSIAELDRAFFSTTYYFIFLMLLKISSTLLSPILFEHDIVELEKKIDGFLLSVKLNYGENFITAKFHHMLHYPFQIRQFGAPVRFSTFCSERSYQLLKRAVHSNKNISDSIAKFASVQSIMYAESFDSNMFNPSLKKTPKLLAQYFKEKNMPVLAKVPIFNSLRYGTHFSSGCVILMKYDQETFVNKIPVFGYIHLVTELDNEPFILVESLLSVESDKSKQMQIDTSYASFITHNPTFNPKKMLLMKLADLQVFRSFSCHEITNFNASKSLAIIVDSLPLK